MNTPLIFHVPHASVRVPNEWRREFVLDDEQLAREILVMTDAHTDRLFASASTEGDEHVVFPVSRLVVDPERFLDDQAEPMAARGMGVVYALRHDGTSLRADLSSRDALVARYYVPHHRRLEEAVTRHLREHGRAVIIDCHSFPLQPLPCDLVQEAFRPDMCIGMDPFHAPESVTEAIVGAFEGVGYTVGVNLPFAGSIVPLSFYRREPRVLSLMIEVRRDLYMNEETGAPSDEFTATAGRVALAIQALRCAAWP